jgi:hypothetical protein
MLFPMTRSGACANCSAEPETGRVSCGNCAAVSRYGLSQAEEFQALDEFRALLERVGADKVAGLWRSAYVPEHWQPAAKAFGHAIHCVTDDGAASRAAHDRAQAIFNAAVLSNLGDPHVVAAAPIMKEALADAWATAIQGERLEHTRQRSERGQRKLWLVAACSVLGYLAILVYVIASKLG